MFYYGVRKWVYHASPAGDISELIDLDLATFFGGAPSVVRKVVAAAQARGKRQRNLVS